MPALALLFAASFQTFVARDMLLSVPPLSPYLVPEERPAVALGPRGPLVAWICYGGLRLALVNATLSRSCDAFPRIGGIVVGPPKVLAGARGAIIAWSEFDPNRPFQIPRLRVVVLQVTPSGATAGSVSFPSADSPPRAAVIGDRYLVAWTGADGLRFAVLDDHLAILASPTRLTDTAYDGFAVAASGDRFAVVENAATGLCMWTLTADGVVQTGPIALGAHSKSASQVDVVGYQGGFLVGWVPEDSPDRIVLQQISNDGRLGRRQSANVDPYPASVIWLRMSAGGGFNVAYETQSGAPGSVLFAFEMKTLHLATPASVPALVDDTYLGLLAPAALEYVVTDDFDMTGDAAHLVAAWPRFGRIWLRLYDIESPERRERRPGQ
jgi:hypothetical protein